MTRSTWTLLVLVATVLLQVVSLAKAYSSNAVPACVERKR